MYIYIYVYIYMYIYIYTYVYICVSTQVIGMWRSRVSHFSKVISVVIVYGQLFRKVIFPEFLRDRGQPIEEPRTKILKS